MLQFYSRLRQVFLCIIITFSFIYSNDDFLVPIIFIHKNNADYLKDTLWQAKHFNKRVILIGDDTNNCYSDIEHYNISDYSQAANSFARIYTHLNGYSYEFSLINFQRWFILHEFIDKHKIPVCFYCDSDQMLYCNITQEYNNYFKQYDMSVISVGYHGGMASYWTPQALAALCKTLQDFYEDKEQIERLAKEFKEGTIKQWYADDCPHFTDFVNTNSTFKIGTLNALKDGALFDPIVWYDFYYDHSRNKSFKFQMTDTPINNTLHKHKNIQWINGYPYCYNNDLQQLIRFKSIHFQGLFKVLIKNYRSDTRKTTYETAVL